MIEKLERYTRNIIRFLYGWLTTDGEVLGYILGVVHFVISMTIIAMVIISHTLYPSFWFQLGVFICLFVIWLQHIFLKVCIAIVAEKNFTNHEPPFYKIIRDVLGINPDDFTTYFVIAETMAVGCFGLELLARISVFIHEFYDIYL
jgi:hypothetical protein